MPPAWSQAADCADIFRQQPRTAHKRAVVRARPEALGIDSLPGATCAWCSGERPLGPHRLAENRFRRPGRVNSTVSEPSERSRATLDNGSREGERRGASRHARAAIASAPRGCSGAATLVPCAALLAFADRRSRAGAAMLCGPHAASARAHAPPPRDTRGPPAHDTGACWPRAMQEL